MSQWNLKTKTMVLVQATPQDAQAVSIPIPSDFYDLGKTWFLKYGGSASLPKGSSLYRRVYIGDLLLSELRGDSIEGDPIVYSDEVTVVCYQDMLVDTFSKGVANIQRPSVLEPGGNRAPRSGLSESTMSMYDSPLIDRAKPIRICFWVAPILSQVAVYLSYATLDSNPA